MRLERPQQGSGPAGGSDSLQKQLFTVILELAGWGGQSGSRHENRRNNAGLCPALLLQSNKIPGQVSLHTHTHAHARAHTHTRTRRVSGNSLSILAAKAGILVFLALELFLEPGHLGKLSKSTGPSGLGWLHQGHKKQTIWPSPQVEQTKVPLMLQPWKALEGPVGGGLA